MGGSYSIEGVCGDCGAIVRSDGCYVLDGGYWNGYLQCDDCRAEKGAAK